MTNALERLVEQLRRLCLVSAPSQLDAWRIFGRNAEGRVDRLTGKLS